jgi:hypothetical protein
MISLHGLYDKFCHFKLDSFCITEGTEGSFYFYAREPISSGSFKAQAYEKNDDLIFCLF